MHPTIQYQLAQTITSERLQAAERRSRSVTAAPDHEQPARHDLHHLTSLCRYLVRRMTRRPDLSTQR